MNYNSYWQKSSVPCFKVNQQKDKLDLILNSYLTFIVCFKEMSLKEAFRKENKNLKEICANHMNISKGYTPVLSQTISKMMDIMQYD